MKPQIIVQNSDDLTKLRFTDLSTHLPDGEIYVSMSALLVHLKDNECEPIDGFYKGAVQFYQRSAQNNLILNTTYCTSFHFLTLPIVRTLNKAHLMNSFPSLLTRLQLS